MGITLYPALPILIVDDDDHIINSYEFTLNFAGIDNIIKCNDSREVKAIVSEVKLDLILLDLSMPYISGRTLLKELSKEYPNVMIIIITGDNDIDTAVDCMKYGAFDYILKPVEENRFVNSVKRAIHVQELRRENDFLKKKIFTKKLLKPKAFSKIITQNKKMYQIFHYMEAISKTSEPILITGETGVGKELIASALHELSERKGRLVTTNVAGLDDQMFSDTLFGHSKGAYTHAEKSRDGLLERALGGTLFLDEIGDLSQQSQVKLLRLLQEHEYYPLGVDEPRYTDALIILATNKDISDLTTQGHFRRDLFYRLNVHQISPIPLRERLDDIPILIDHFLEEAAESLGKKKPAYPPELITLLSTYHFPGNIRELKAMIYDAFSRHKSKVLSLETFRTAVTTNLKTESKIKQKQSSNRNIKFAEILPSLKQVQNELIKEAMKRSNNNQTIASQLLGISRQALNQRLKTEKG